MTGSYYIVDRDVKQLLDRLSSQGNLFAPVEGEGFYRFDVIKRGEDVRLDYSNTRLPAKSTFLPQLEKLFEYNLVDGHVEKGSGTTGSLVIFGMRPCDASSLSVLDQVMCGKYADTYYQSRRKRTTVIALSCLEPRDTCFCRVFGTGPIEGAGSDLTLTRLDGGYHARVSSSQGLDFITRHRDLMQTLSEGQEARYRSIKNEVENSMQGTLDSDAAELRISHDSMADVWKGLAERCLGCGVCSFVCPVCYCYDVCESKITSRGMRFRGWDSCAFITFSRMSSGLDPRPNASDRLRHRFAHKFQYIPETFGVRGCVGCGRCLELCPANIDVREILGI